jgi:hypothetical protein
MANNKQKWLQGAAEKMKKKGTVGLFTKKAENAGKSVQQYATEKYHAKGKLGEEARFAKNSQK